MSDREAADRAYAAAVELIREARKAGSNTLDLDVPDCRAIDRIPEEIAVWGRLRSLDLRNTAITDLLPLAGLTGLQTLYLSNTPVADLSPLAGMTGMHTLYLSGTAVADVAPLAGMTGMHMLILSETAVADVAPLARMAGIQTLHLNGTAVADVAPLAGMTGLRELSLTGTAVADVAPLAGMTGMWKLHLSRSRVEDLRALTGMAELGGDLPGDGTNGLRYRGTPATQLDPRLAELDMLEDDRTRARETVAYLRTLPPWPEPLPWLTKAPVPGPDDLPLRVEALLTAQEPAGWRFSPLHGALDLYVQDAPTEARQAQLAKMTRERVTKLVAAVKGNSGVRGDVADEAGRFAAILDDDSRSLAVRSLELWGSLIALGDLLDANDQGARAGRDVLDLLPQEGRAALSTMLAVAATLVRSFPEARELDDASGAFARREASLQPMLRMLEAAMQAGLVAPHSAAVIQHVAKVAEGKGPQADKARAVSAGGGRNLVTAATWIASRVGKGAATGAGFAAGVLATEAITGVSDHFDLGEAAGRFVEGQIDYIQAFMDSLAPDERARLNAELEDMWRARGEPYSGAR